MAQNKIPKLAVASRSFVQNPILMERLRRTFPDIAISEEGASLTGQRLAAFLEDSEAAIISTQKVDDTVLALCPKLKVISKYGVGKDNIDEPALQKRGVRFYWKGGVNRRSVSELTLGLILGLLRRIPAHHNQITHGKWNQILGQQLSTKTVGIIGFGFIGQDLKTLLEPFGCKLLINDILTPPKGIHFCSKDEIIKNSDVITLHVPYTAPSEPHSTHDLLNQKTFDMMKTTVSIVNTSRGKIINENDLLEFLQKNKNAGAALDVFSEEPKTNSPLYALSNFIGTPHIGGTSEEGVLAMGNATIEFLEKHYSNP
jgi:phosphoglycerate dehydrogenase-like enzyme